MHSCHKDDANQFFHVQIMLTSLTITEPALDRRFVIHLLVVVIVVVVVEKKKPFGSDGFRVTAHRLGDNLHLFLTTLNSNVERISMVTV